MADADNEAPSPTGNEDYLTELLKEREKIDPQCKYTIKLLQQEIDRLHQPMNDFVKDSQKCLPSFPHLQIHSGRPCRVQVKVHVPVKDHPNFNFVGKLLGPKGSSLKQLQEITQTRMAILGRGSVRDKQKEEEMRMECNPKYFHLQEELHVEITAFATPAEAYRRISTALTEVKQYLVPDYFDDIRQHQLRELAILKDEKLKSRTLESDFAESDPCSDTNPSLLVSTACPTVMSSISTEPRCSISSRPYELMNKLKEEHFLSNNYLATNLSATNGKASDPGILRKTLRNNKVNLMNNEYFQEYGDNVSNFNNCTDEDIPGNTSHHEEIHFNCRSDFSDPGEQFLQTHKPCLRESVSSQRRTARFQTHPYNLNHTSLH